MDGAVLLNVRGVKLRRGDAKTGAKAVKGTLTLTETHVVHTAKDGTVASLALRRVLKQMHSQPNAKTPVLALRLKDESQDDYKFIFQSETDKDQTKDMVAQCLVNPINTQEGAAAAAAAKKSKQNVVAIGEAAGGGGGGEPNPEQLLQTAEAAALKENPVLLDLCKETTKEGGAFSQAEFWEGWEHDGGRPSGHASASAEAAASRIGISSDVLAKFKPEQQLTSEAGTKYRITPDMQEQIFRVYPALKRLYDEKVTHTREWEPKIFWDKAVKSELFHRGTRQAPLAEAGATSDITELFAKCRQKTGVSSSDAGGGGRGVVAAESAGEGAVGSGAAAAPLGRAAEPRYDLDATEDRDLDGYGTTSDAPAQRFRQRARNRIDVAIINADSESILDRMVDDGGGGGGAAGGGGVSEASGGGKRRRVASDPYESLRRTEHLDDLDPEPAPPVVPLHFSLASIAAKCAATEAAGVDEAATAAASTGGGGGGGTSDGVAGAGTEGPGAASALVFRADPTSLATPALTRAGAAAVTRLADAHMTDGGEGSVSAALAVEVNKYDVALSLVMRHYWSCFPPSAPPPELDDPRGKKASRLKGTLERECLEARVTPLRERVEREHPDHARIVANLEDRVRVAVAHADAWKAAARRSLLERKRAAKKRKAPDD